MKVSLKSEISTFVAKVALDFIHSHVSERRNAPDNYQTIFC